MTYITGDKHGNFDFLSHWCEYMGTTEDDTLIIAGDAGINYYLGYKDIILKERILRSPITILCVQGNHEQRPEKIEGYQLEKFHSGEVYVEPKYPNIKFAKNGSLFKFEDYNGEDKTVLIIGGAYSVDKEFRLKNGLKWFPDEQLSYEEKTAIYYEYNNKRVNYIISHTCPKSVQPTELFLKAVDQKTVDNSMEIYLDRIKSSVGVHRWYYGHYHSDLKRGGFRLLFKDIIKLGE